MPDFNVKRYGTPLEQAGLRHRLAHGITYTYRFEHFEACVAAGLDIERWMTGGYDRSLMAQVVAWHRLRNMIDAHVEDARASHMERQAKRRK